MADANAVIDYGRGRSRRRTSRCAVLSLTLAVLLSVLGLFVLGIYRGKPPPASGFAGVGWHFAFYGTFNILLVSTWVAGPAAMALGVAGWAAVARQPDRLRGRSVAVAGLVMSVLLLASVSAARVWLERPRSGTVAGPATASVPSDYPAYPEQAAVSHLVAECRRYAARHDGQYPPDAAAFRDWLTRRPGEDPLADYVYVGGALGEDEPGLPYDEVRAGDNNRLILVIRRRPVSGGRWVIGAKGDPFRSSVYVVPEGRLAQTFAECNAVRRKLNLPELDFAALLAAPTAPATAPAAQPPAIPIQSR